MISCGVKIVRTGFTSVVFNMIYHNRVTDGAVTTVRKNAVTTVDDIESLALTKLTKIDVFGRKFNQTANTQFVTCRFVRNLAQKRRL